MEHTEKYLQAKWVTENPKGYDERDVARANSYCEAYLEGYNQALSIANVVGRSEQLKALEDLKDFAYDNCQPHNSDRLAEIMERL